MVQRFSLRRQYSKVSLNTLGLSLKPRVFLSPCYRSIYSWSPVCITFLLPALYYLCNTCVMHYHFSISLPFFIFLLFDNMPETGDSLSFVQKSSQNEQTDSVIMCRGSSWLSIKHCLLTSLIPAVFTVNWFSFDPSFPVKQFSHQCDQWSVFALYLRSC